MARGPGGPASSTSSATFSSSISSSNTSAINRVAPSPVRMVYSVSPAHPSTTAFASGPDISNLTVGIAGLDHLYLPYARLTTGMPEPTEPIKLAINDRGFVYDPKNRLWLPPLNAKQVEVFDDFHRYLLVHGPRKSGKTFGIIHKVIRHAFDVRAGMIAIVCKTIKNAKAAGVWPLSVRMLKIWCENCAGFKILEGPKTTAVSYTHLTLPTSDLV